MKLKEYIEKQNETSYFSGLLERYYLAQEFIYSFNDEYREKNGKNVATIVPFFNLDNIEIQEVQPDEDTSVKHYKVIFPDVKSILPKNELFANCPFADYRTLKCKPALGKVHDSNNGEVSALYKKEEYLVSTLSVILFYIYFGYHPLCGRDYYGGANISSDTERLFFQKKHDFIFKLDENSNRFVNGYHNGAWALWNAISDVQQAFWKDVFCGATKNYADFYRTWEKAYAGFTETLVATPCDVKLKTIVYDEQYALVTSDNTIGNKTIRCRGCNNDLSSRCENCQIALANRNASLLIIKVKLITQQTNDGNSCEVENEIELYSGKTLYTTAPQSESQSAVFEVIASKKSNLLGLRYLADIPLEANCGTVTRFYKKDETIALLPGTQIHVLHVMPELQKIVVPGVPIEVVAPKTQVNAPTLSTQKSATNVLPPLAQSQPGGVNPSTAHPPIVPPVVKSIDTATVVTANSTGTKQDTIAKVVKPDADDANLIYTEDDNICDLVPGTREVERQGYKIYTVKGRRNQIIYTLKLFDIPSNEEEKKNQSEIISNIRSILSQKTTLPLSFLYPKSIVVSKGFANNRVGYIYKELPSTAKPVSYIINEDIRKGFDSREIAALLDLFNTVKILHSKKMLYNRIELKNVYMDIDNEKCFLVDNENVSVGSQKLAPLWFFSAPEIIFGGRTNEQSDCYSLAVIAFMVLYKMHPYGNTSWKNKPELDRSAKQAQYVDNPQFVFDPFRKSRTNPMTLINSILPTPEEDKWRDTPYYIQELFKKTFIRSMFTMDKNRMYKDRPTMQKWCDELDRWNKDLKAQKR